MSVKGERDEVVFGSSGGLMSPFRPLAAAHLPLLMLVCAAPPALAGSEKSPILGFSPPAADAERALEARLDAALDPALLGEWMRRLAARPHHVGSPYGRENAEYLAGLFREWGFDTRIEEYQVLFPTPKERLVELVSPVRYRARLAEPALPEDATSGQAGEQLPVYNAYSIDGDATAPLVYVNYGVPKDYEELERRGIDVKGKIVIARYGGSWRGIKPKVAAEHGAAGCLIYSDPRDDGYVQGDAYPKGAWRGEWGAQRGSVVDMPLFSGDPLTPGVAATKDAKRLELKDAPTLTKIPVLPIAYGDALPLLRALAGPVAPEAWRGGLPITYRLGPGPATVRLQLAFDWSRGPARLGEARPVGDPRQPPRCVGERGRRPRERTRRSPGRGPGGGPPGPRGLAPPAHDRLRGLGRRGAGAHRLHRVGRGPRGGAEDESGGLRQLRRQRPRLPGGRRLPRPRAAGGGGGEGGARPAAGLERRRAPAGPPARGGEARGEEGGPRAPRP